MKTKKKKVAVFAGGLSSERPISILSGEMVAKALESEGYEVCKVDPNPNTGWTLPEGTDVAFLVTHGTYGEDGQLQAELDHIGVPYTGSGAEASRIGFDKLLTRQHCEAAGVLMPQAMLLEHSLDSMPVGWNPPVILKPVCEGSSVGLHTVNQVADFPAALKEALTHGGRVLMERKIVGRELTVGILDGKPLPLVEVRPRSGTYDYKSKYTKGETEYLCPAPVEDSIVHSAQAIALKTFQAVGAKDYARVDMIVDDSQTCWVLEINTLPGMCETSLLPKAAAALGIGYAELCSKIVQMALRK